VERRTNERTGLAVVGAGNLYLAVPTVMAIQFGSAAGKALGLIRVPENLSDADLGGEDLKTLSITAQRSLNAVPIEVEGERFGTRGS
jgi:sugar lactone lactonase YvrE